MSKIKLKKLKSMQHEQIHEKNIPVKNFTSFKRDRTNSTFGGSNDDVIVTTTRDFANLVPNFRHGQQQRAVPDVPDFDNTIM